MGAIYKSRAPATPRALADRATCVRVRSGLRERAPGSVRASACSHKSTPRHPADSREHRRCMLRGRLPPLRRPRARRVRGICGRLQR